jgi:site-specific DNA recombinase
MKQVAIYLRQSQDRDGTGYGIDRQREDVSKLVAAQGWQVVAEFVDNDVSALSRKPRPAFTDMMARVDAGEFDVIAARHMDRLLRRLAELESVLERCAKTHTAIVTAADGVDTSSDGGRLVARILSSVAQGEVERKSARQRSAVAQAAKQGRWCGGRRAFGYEKDGVTVREGEAVLIKQGYADVLAGESLGEIARRWTASGFMTTQGLSVWNRGAVKDVLTNPRHAGLRRHRSPEDRADIRANPELGITGKAEWPAIVDEATWRAVVRIVCDPARRHEPLSAKGLLTGLAVCGACDETVHRGAATGGVRMYRCRSGKHVHRRSDPIDQYVEAVALGILKEPNAADLWAAELPDASNLMAEADTLRRRRDDIALDYADGAMTREQFRTANTRIQNRLGELESRIAAAGTTSPLSIVAAEDIDKRWAELSTAQKRAIIGALMTPVIELVGGGSRGFNPDSVRFRWKVKR